MAVEEPLPNRIGVRLRRKADRSVRVKCSCNYEEDVGQNELSDELAMQVGMRVARRHNRTQHNSSYRMFKVTEREFQ